MSFRPLAIRRSGLPIAAAICAALLVPSIVPLATPTVDAVSCKVTTRLYPSITDDAVECLEERLIELGYPGINGPDRIYDSVSVNAVKSFQLNRGLYADGRVTSITARQLGLRGPLPAANAARITVLGDSTSAAMRSYDEAANGTARYDVLGNDYDLLWAVESCRRLVNRSCGSRTDPSTGVRWTPPSVLPLMQTSLRGNLGEAIVIMAGYDDTSIVGAIESIMAEAKAQGVAKVFWLNYRLSVTYNNAYQGHYREHNANLAAAKVRHPNLVVLDWNGYTYSQPASTQDLWFSDDQIHLSGAGALALANYLKASIDGYQLASCQVLNANAGSIGGSSGPASAPTAESGFQAIAPTRVLDTRATRQSVVATARWAPDTRSPSTSPRTFPPTQPQPFSTSPRLTHVAAVTSSCSRAARNPVRPTSTTSWAAPPLAWRSP